jgi:hypothetical protein
MKNHRFARGGTMAADAGAQDLLLVQFDTA